MKSLLFLCVFVLGVAFVAANGEDELKRYQFQRRLPNAFAKVPSPYLNERKDAYNPFLGALMRQQEREALDRRTRRNSHDLTRRGCRIFSGKQMFEMRDMDFCERMERRVAKLEWL